MSYTSAVLHQIKRDISSSTPPVPTCLLPDKRSLDTVNKNHVDHHSISLTGHAFHPGTMPTPLLASTCQAPCLKYLERKKTRDRPIEQGRCSQPHTHHHHKPCAPHTNAFLAVFCLPSSPPTGTLVSFANFASLAIGTAGVSKP